MDAPKYVQLIISANLHDIAAQVAKTKGFKSVRAWAKFLLEREIEEESKRGASKSSRNRDLETKRN